ncbi:hypothetical protein [Nocardioides sp. SYSU DS0651]|uniref:hypothetical protein n=1 Tax=Nocardioides sp. SYSU DS0651 TaxID=3415955 RepID=UPI003F4B0979
MPGAARTTGWHRAAGVLWWLTGREDDEARIAVAAWEERYGNAEARWHSIPAPVRRLADSDERGDRKSVTQRVDELRAALPSHQRDFQRADRRMRWPERVACVALLACLLSILALLAIGAWTVVQWLLH